ncbi:hypothetical protein JTE90_026298 [Oedothorax gibbosus]|uniref:Metalloendopeptidase n=1 Tax=Oedothorax gibbosus TaxID=931172 RepID=A0AAV6U2S4_9ARAC|nr:hypothetical protein JTE90_026298 [Oedothorax gibbosus]
MKEIECYSRVRFSQNTHDDGKCLLITNEEGCYFSPTDCEGSRPRNCRPRLSIGDGCWSRGTILHELMHVLGFEHEHQRPDRNRHLKVKWGNIDRDAASQFKRLEKNEFFWDITRFPFDYYSVMLYGEYDFSRNGHKTLMSKNRRGWRDHNTLSRLDKIKVRLL